MRGVQMQPAARLRAQQMTVRGRAQLFEAVAAQRKAKVAADPPVFHLQPLGGAAQAVFAWEHVGCMQRVERQLPARKLRRQLAVRVVLMRTQPQPDDLLRRGGKLTAQADARGRGQTGGLFHLNLQLHLALGVDAVALAAEKRQPVLRIPAVQYVDLDRVRQRLSA